MEKKKGRVLTTVFGGAVLMVLLTGCTLRELEDREFPQGMELYYSQGKLLGGWGEFLVEGDTVEDILREYQNGLDKYLDLGHVKALVLGESLMEEERVVSEVLVQLEKMPVLARSILVFTSDREGILGELKEKGIVPGEYLSNLYKNNPYKKHDSTATLGELLNEDYFTSTNS